MKIIVTGAGGWIGQRVVRRAIGLGCEVIAFNRTTANLQPGLISRLVDISSDFTRGLARDPVLRESVAVIHCAGLAHRPNEALVDRGTFNAVNRDGTFRLIRMAREVGIPRIVYVSSIAFYDWRKGHGVDEESSLFPSTEYAASKLAGEQVCRESGLDFRIARLGTVFGDGDQANFAKLARAIGSGRFVIPGNGEARKSVLPVTLAAELLVDLALMDVVAERIINLALPEAPTLTEICDSYSEICGFGRAWRVPLSILKMSCLIGDIIDRIRPGFSVTSSNVRKLTTSTAVSTARMESVWPRREWPVFRGALKECAHYYRSLAPR